MSEVNFEPWPKIPRHGKGTVVITEKIDGTNGQINIVKSELMTLDMVDKCITRTNIDGQGYHMFVGSRKRYIIPDEDNFGFAAWVLENAEELFKMGEGRHFGEWYGGKIQIGYGIEEKRFALFNTSRWGSHNPSTPECCDVVPVLYSGDLKDETVEGVMGRLKVTGSQLVKGFMEPEGIITYDSATRQLTKLTFKHTEGKWKED